MRSLTEYLDSYVYSIETVDGKKRVHIDGYVYCEDCTYKLVQFIGMYVDIDKVPTTSYPDLESETKSTIEDISYEEAIAYYANLKERALAFFVDGHSADGTYIDII